MSAYNISFFFLQGESGIEFLRNQPQFRELRRLVQQNPQTLPQLLQQIGQDNPDLLQVQCIVTLLFNLWFWSLALYNDGYHTQVLCGSWNYCFSKPWIFYCYNKVLLHKKNNKSIINLLLLFVRSGCFENLEMSWKFLKILASPKIFYCILIMEAGRVERLRQSHLFTCWFVVLDQLQCTYFKWIIILNKFKGEVVFFMKDKWIWRRK